MINYKQDHSTRPNISFHPHHSLFYWPLPDQHEPEFHKSTMHMKEQTILPLPLSVAQAKICDQDYHSHPKVDFLTLNSGEKMPLLWQKSTAMISCWKYFHNRHSLRLPFGYLVKELPTFFIFHDKVKLNLGSASHDLIKLDNVRMSDQSHYLDLWFDLINHSNLKDLFCWLPLWQNPAWFWDSLHSKTSVSEGVSPQKSPQLIPWHQDASFIIHSELWKLLWITKLTASFLVYILAIYLPPCVTAALLIVDGHGAKMVGGFYNRSHNGCTSCNLISITKGFLSVWVFLSASPCFFSFI